MDDDIFLAGAVEQLSDEVRVAGAELALEARRTGVWPNRHRCGKVAERHHADPETVAALFGWIRHVDLPERCFVNAFFPHKTFGAHQLSRHVRGVPARTWKALAIAHTIGVACPGSAP